VEKLTENLQQRYQAWSNVRVSQWLISCTFLNSCFAILGILSYFLRIFFSQEISSTALGVVRMNILVLSIGAIEMNLFPIVFLRLELDKL